MNLTIGFHKNSNKNQSWKEKSIRKTKGTSLVNELRV